MRPDALDYFIDVYNREVAGATARHAVERQALEAEMGRVDREIANLVTAIAGGLNNPSVKARLDALEAERAVLLAESAKPAPAAISLHPGAASLWRAKIRALWAALGEGDGAAMTRSEEHTSELQSLMRISYAVFCLKKKNRSTHKTDQTTLT